MNRIVRLLTVITSIILGGSIMVSCGKGGISIDEKRMAPTNGKDGVGYSYSTYDNSSFNTVDNGGGIDAPNLKGQWETGIADPFIMRWNGTYYLYCTTSGANSRGLRAWKSRDLIHWDKCRGEGLPEGYVVSTQDEAEEGGAGRYTQNAYAPEVYHFNGKFYMFISPGSAASSRGHYVLVADNPEGPFEYHAGRLDTRIDGSLFIDDDETMYFLHATSGAITVRPIENMKDLGDSVQISATNLMGGWTEGPAMIKIRGQYYLTYTGLHYQTPAYQVCYAVSDFIDKTSVQTVADSFRVGARNPMLLNCDRDEGHVGTGHSANFLGPDLDSYYIVYHNLDELYADAMTHRSVNIDRLLVSDGLMTSVPNRDGSIAPARPRFYSYSAEEGFASENGMLLSTASTNGRFTVEFNSRGDAEVKYILSYRSTDDYAYVTVDYAGKQIRLVQVSGGQETELATGTLKHEFSADDLHAVRVAYDDGKVWVYFDDMCKIAADVNLKGGKIGYMGSETLEVGYTAISDHANGSSDRAEIKQALGDTTAASYLEEGSIEGVGAYQLTGGSGMRETEGSESEYLGTSELYLENAYDYARYLVNFHDGGEYGMELVLNKKYCGKTICVQIDGGENQLLTIPDASAAEEDYVRVYLKKFSVSAGVRQVKIQNVGEAFAFVSFAFSKVDTDYEFSSPLTEASLQDIRDAVFVTDGYTATGSALSVAGKREFVYFGKRNISDFEMEVEIAVQPQTLLTTSPVGVIFRQDNYADADVPGANFTDYYCHVQGYYLQVTKNAVVLSRYNFGNVKSYELTSKTILSEPGTFYKYKISAVQNTIEIWRDGEQVLRYTDPLAFNTGAVGFYSHGGTGRYRNLMIKTL